MSNKTIKGGAAEAVHDVVAFRPGKKTVDRLRLLAVRTGLDVTTLCRLAVHELLEQEYSPDAIFKLNVAAKLASDPRGTNTTPATP